MMARPGGQNSLLIAVDTADVTEVGHVSEFLEETILMQIPFKDGVVPEHEVLYQEPCSGDELLGSKAVTEGVASGRDEL